MSYLKQTFLYSLITVAVVAIGLFIYSVTGGELSFTSVGSDEKPKHAMVYPAFRPVPPFTLYSGEQAITNEVFNDQWSFVFFGYTYCPDVCPTTMSALNSFYQQLPEDFKSNTQVILVSVDPERDTPEQLAQYSKAFHPEFIGATADHEALEPFTRSFGAVYYKVGEDSEDYLVDHTAKIFLVDPDGKRHAFFSKSMENPTQGYEYNIPQMVEDYSIIRRNY